MTQAEAAPLTLDEAWTRAEAALPGDLWQMLVGSTDDAEGRGWWATGSSPRDEWGGYRIVSTSEGGVLHNTPADALLALAEKLEAES